MLVLRGLSDVVGFHNPNGDGVLAELIAEFESIIESADYLAGAPFKKIIVAIISRYHNDSVPTYRRKRRGSDELEAWIEIDFRPIQSAKRDEIKALKARATYLALLDIGKKHGLRIEAFRRCAEKQFPFLKSVNSNSEIQPSRNAYLEAEIKSGGPRIEVELMLRNDLDLSTELQQLDDLEDQLADELEVRCLGRLEGHFTTANSRQITVHPVSDMAKLFTFIRDELAKLAPAREGSVTAYSADSEVVIKDIIGGNKG